MPFLAECILCRQKLRLPDKAAGASVQCPRCGSYFTAAPEENVLPSARRIEPLPAPLPAPLPVMPPAPVTPVAPVPRAKPVIAVAPPAPPAPPEEPPIDEMLPEVSQSAIQLPVFPLEAPKPQGLSIEPIGAGAILAGGLAGWCTVVFSLTFLVIPLAIVGTLTGLVGLAAGLLAEPPRWVLATVGTVANVGLLLAALFFPSWLGATYQLARERGQPQVDAPRVVALEGKPLAQGETVSDWPDAARFAVQVKSVRLEIVSAEVRPVEIATTPRKKFTKESYLVIRLRAHQPAGGSEFASDAWGKGGNTQDRRQPVLSDDTGKAIAPAPVKVRGEAVTLTKRSADFPLGITDEVYLFEAPPAGASTLRLEIPAAGWGGNGTVRFGIPQGMLKSGLPKLPEKSR